MAKKTIADSDWEKRLNEAQVKKEDLNRLVMDYLVIEGYKDAALRFSHETGLEPSLDLNSIETRMVIRSAVQRGDVAEAISRVNDLDSEILDENWSLFFHLQQQRVIELIRAGRPFEALQFASDELAPKAEEYPVLLAELERTMALLAFDLPSSNSGASGSAPILEPPPHIAELLSPAQKLRTAGELNAAILASQSQGADPKLTQMLRLMVHGEALLGTEGPGKAAFPRLALSQALASSGSSSSVATAHAAGGASE